MFNKMPSPAPSSLCILCQHQGIVIAGDDFSVKSPSHEARCYLCPEHFHLALILVPGLQFHSVFAVLYQGNGIFSPSRKFVSSPKPPLLQLLLQSNNRCSPVPSLSILIHCLSSVNTVKPNRNLSVSHQDTQDETHLLIRASQTTSMGSFSAVPTPVHHFPSVFSN